MKPSNEKNLERFVHRALRELPARRAPLSLESRVLAALAERASLPWWRKSFAHWPLAAQVAFLTLSALLVKVALMVTIWVLGGLDGPQLQRAFASPLAWMGAISAVSSATAEFFNIVVRNIPSLWLYGGLAFFAALYAALFGLGATAYRTLYANR